MLTAWILAARPKTLSAAFVPIIVATALASNPDWVIASLALMASLLIQVGTNLVNDAIDYEKGADTSTRLGPMRATQSGLLSSIRVMQGALFAFTLALLVSIPLMLKGGYPIAALLTAAILAGYCYTGGPYPLSYLGLGDFFVLLFFGWGAVGGVYFLQEGNIGFDAFVAGTQVGLLSCVLIGINNLRDVKGDALANKKTLPVRYGVRFGKFLVLSEILLPFLLLGWWASRSPLAAVLPLLAFPIASWLIVQLLKEPPSRKYNGFLAVAALQQVLFGICLAFGL